MQVLFVLGFSIGTIIIVVHQLITHLDQKPLVSVICLCYNHNHFVKQAIESVWNQSYNNIELIIIDDCSTDGSQETIQAIIQGKDILFIRLAKNVGNTTAFNKGLEYSNGEYIIDLSADDVLHEIRIEKQVNFFLSCEEKIGVIYSNAQYIDAHGNHLSQHFSNKRISPLEGNIYEHLISKYFIPTPTMMIRKKVFDELGGYDESLAYEDFDFWVRSSRNWHYGFQDEVLTYIRQLHGSMSKGWYQKDDQQLHSTYQVCKKIEILNKSESENQALVQRIKHEIKQSVFSENHENAILFFSLLENLNASSLFYNFLKKVNSLKMNLSIVRKIYHKLKYGS